MRASTAVSPASVVPIFDANSGPPLGDLLGAPMGVILPGLGFGGYLISLVRVVNLTLRQYSSSPANRLLNVFRKRNVCISIR